MQRYFIPISRAGKIIRLQDAIWLPGAFPQHSAVSGWRAPACRRTYVVALSNAGGLQLSSTYSISVGNSQRYFQSLGADKTKATLAWECRRRCIGLHHCYIDHHIRSAVS